jgi:hypothetical protein
MVGILVDGDNHFIVRGRLPARKEALALVRHWSLIQIGKQTPVALAHWTISTKEFREDLQWAIVVPSDREVSVAVRELLAGMQARGVRIHSVAENDW